MEKESDMDHVHEMLIEDEIVMCAIVLGTGIIVGAIARFLFRGRTPSKDAVHNS
jgi:hypothetical protein